MVQLVRYPENNPVQINDQVTQPWTNYFYSVYEACFAIYQSGTTAQRPTKNRWIGRPYFDTTLGYTIWWDNSNWVDATGGTV